MRDLSRPARGPGPLRRCLAVLAFVGFLAGCSVQLSPAPDQALFDNLTSLNVQTQTLFAGLTHRGSVGEFSGRAETYDALIGGYAAARLVAASREVPAEGLRLADRLGEICVSDPVECVNPTPHHLDKIITLLTAMRDAHERGRLVGALVAGPDGTGGFKGQYEIEMSRILLFEAALQR